MSVEERKGTDFNVVRKVKNDICNAPLLNLILSEDVPSRHLYWRLTEAFLPQKVDWKPDDPKGKREKAYTKLKQMLNPRGG
jgi:hypothetical protein